MDAHVAPTRAQDRPVPAARSGRAGDRPVHARPRRGTTAGEGRRPLLHHRGPAGLLRRHREPCTASSTWPTPRTSRPPSPALAAQLKDLGSDESLDVRRAFAVGEMARAQTDPRPEPHVGRACRDQPKHPAADRLVRPPLRRRPARRGRHRPPGAGQRPGDRRAGPRLVRNRRHGSVKPVIDLDAHDPVDVTGGAGPARRARHAPRQDLRLPVVQPTGPALRQGPLDPPQLVAARPARAISRHLCRRHHRIKTHGAWTYRSIEPGTYLWTSKHGYQYLRDTTGTLDVSRDRPRPPD